MMQKLKLTLLCFEDMEVLDFAGPFEVFSVANQLEDYTLMDIAVVSKDGGIITARNGLKILPDTGIHEVINTDILIIPGGDGTKRILEDEVLMSWLDKLIPQSRIAFSVCSGARILARLGYLDGKPFTTHHEVFEDVQKLTKEGIPVKDQRFVDLGSIMTAAGISAGIDLSLHVVKRLWGDPVQNRVIRYMEYRA
jgi:transcriptional regulator GlxA family with amidase domain